LESGKSYVGSSVNLGRRFRDYYNYTFLEGEMKKNKSMIYRSLVKYGYSNFKLEILEYCEPNILIEREQYYLDLLNPEYNILKIAGSLLGFRHSEATKELMREARKNRIVSEETKLKLAESSPNAQSTMVIDNNTGAVVSFTSARKAAESIGIHHSHSPTGRQNL
jgi:group I intron endonuclease